MCASTCVEVEVIVLSITHSGQFVNLKTVTSAITVVRYSTGQQTLLLGSK